MARRPFIAVSAALATLFLMLWHRGDHPNTELGATKRDSKEANVFPLAENVQLWNWGDVSSSPRTGPLAGDGRGGPSSWDKGPDGNGSHKDLLDLLCQCTPISLCNCPQTPNSHFYVLGQYHESFLLPSSFCPIPPLNLEQSSNWDLPSGYWGAITPKKRLSQGLYTPAQSLPRPGPGS